MKDDPVPKPRFLNTLTASIVQRSPVVDAELSTIDDAARLALDLTGATTLDELVQRLNMEVRPVQPLSTPAIVSGPNAEGTLIILPNARDSKPLEWRVAFGVGVALIAVHPHVRTPPPHMDATTRTDIQQAAKQFATALLTELKERGA